MGEVPSNVEFAHKIHEHGRRTSAGHSSRFHEVVEILEALILAVVAIATAWSGYQAALWDSHQFRLYGESDHMRGQAEALIAASGQEQLYDLSLFTSWLSATSEGNEELAAFVEQRFRDEFEPAFAAWMATDPLTNPEAPAGPSVMPEYRNAKRDEAAGLVEQAAATFAEGTEAREHGDQYVRITVFLATVLLLTAIAQRFMLRAPRVALLVIAVLLLMGAVYRIVGLPRA